MRAQEFITEAGKPKVGREYQHIEDLIYIEGPAGAFHAIERLRQIETTPNALEVKWDGSPDIKFGVDENGEFGFGDKYAKEPLRSAEEVYAYYTRNPENTKFAGHMSEIFNLYKEACRGVSGFFSAGLMYYPGKPKQIDPKTKAYVFVGNTVKYLVDPKSELGKRVAESATGAAITSHLASWKGPRIAIGDSYKDISSPSVVIIPPKFVETPPKINDAQIRAIESKIKTHAAGINLFLSDAPGMGALKGTIYRYCNIKRSSNQWQQIGKDFAEYIANDPDLSDKFKTNMLSRIEGNKRSVDAMFSVVRELIKIKIDILTQSEQPALGSMGLKSQVEVNGKWVDAGEGFVHDPVELGKPLKLVHPTFTAANASRER